MGEFKELLGYKSTRRLLLAAWVLITLAVFLSITTLVLRPASASRTNNLSKKCTTSNESISISGNTATGTFTVPSGCPGTHVLMASYTAPNGTNGKPYSAQKLYASTRAKLGPGRHNLSVRLPNCYYQVDLARGTVLQNFQSTTYTASTNHILMAAQHGGSQPCEKTPPPPPITPGPTKKPPVILENNNVNTQNQSQTTIVNASAPIKQSDEATTTTTSLPETGAGTGAVIATFFGVSSLSSALYYAVTSRLFG